MSSFHLGQPDWNFTPDERSYHVPSIDDKEKVIQTDDDLEAEANRATGDFAIYRYYFDSVGWVGISIFLVCISGFVFCISFPSKFLAAKSKKCLTDGNRYLGQMVGCFQCAIPI